MKEIQLYAGTTIGQACKKLIEKGKGHYFIFNGVKVDYQEGYSSLKYKNYFLTQLEEESFQEVIDTADMKKDLEKIKKYVSLIRCFKHNISLINYLEWLALYIEQSDYICVFSFKVHNNIFLSLKKKGFIKNDLVGDNNIKGNKDKELRWIIGQVMDGLDEDLVYPLLADKIKEWLDTYYPNRGEKEEECY